MDRTIVTIGGYAMTHLEFWGTVLYLWSVWLVGRGTIWTWPIGNVAVVLYAVLFWRIRLYADLAEQVYFFVAGFYGWWAWRRRGRAAAGADRSRSAMARAGATRFRSRSSSSAAC